LTTVDSRFVTSAESVFDSPAEMPTYHGESWASAGAANADRNSAAKAVLRIMRPPWIE
jgi:hypothetical protein